MNEFDFGLWLESDRHSFGTANALSQRVRLLKPVKESTEEIWRGKRPPTHIAMGNPKELLRSLHSVKAVGIAQAFRSASGSAIIPPKFEGEPGIVVLPHIHAITLDLDKDQVEQMQGGGVTVMPNEKRQIPSYSRADTPIGHEISWALDKLGLARSSKYDGSGIAVAVLDTGIDLQHPEFVNRIAPEDQKGFVVGIKNVDDGDGHGTHVAGLIFADGRTRPEGRRIGVAPGVRLIVGKVLADNGFGYDDWILQGIDWAIERGADIINLSLGTPRDVGDGYADVYELTAQTAPHCVIVAAAGNHSLRSEKKLFPVANPSACPSLVAVAAVGPDGKIADFSNPRLDDCQVDVTAPGVKVFSTFLSSQGMFAELDGTSMASPIASAIAALHAQATGARGPELRQILFDNTHRLGPEEDFGRGLVLPPT